MVTFNHENKAIAEFTKDPVTVKGNLGEVDTILISSYTRDDGLSFSQAYIPNHNEVYQDDEKVATFHDIFTPTKDQLVFNRESQEILSFRTGVEDSGQNHYAYNPPPTISNLRISEGGSLFLESESTNTREYELKTHSGSGEGESFQKIELLDIDRSRQLYQLPDDSVIPTGETFNTDGWGMTEKEAIEDALHRAMATRSTGVKTSSTEDRTTERNIEGYETEKTKIDYTKYNVEGFIYKYTVTDIRPRTPYGEDGEYLSGQARFEAFVDVEYGMLAPQPEQEGRLSDTLLALNNQN